LFVYYCRYSGKHAMTTDCDIETLPRRGSDGSYVLDTSRYVTRMYAVDGGEKYVRRGGDAGSDVAERQLRLHVGSLPVAYRTEEGGSLLYILKDALSSFSNESEQLEAMVPPCILGNGEGGVQLMIDFEDRQKATKILSISADGLRMSVRTTLDSHKAKDEVFEFFGRVLNKQFRDFALLRGVHGFSSRVLEVRGMGPEACYKKVYEAVKKGVVLKDKKVEQQAVAIV